MRLLIVFSVIFLLSAGGAFVNQWFGALKFGKKSSGLGKALESVEGRHGESPMAFDFILFYISGDSLPSILFQAFLILVALVSFALAGYFLIRGLV